MHRLFTPRYVLVLFGLCLGAFIAPLVTAQFWSRGVDGNSADAGFLRDMGVHHAQAVEMALIIRDRTDNVDLHTLATDIVLTQVSELGLMSGWLQIWDLPQTGGNPAMSWMGHPVQGRMPGMASAEEIQQLRDLPLPEAEVLFLRLMIRHHHAAVGMAEACLERCDEDVVVRLARGTVRSQNGEVEAMQSMLQTRGQEPEPVGP